MVKIQFTFNSVSQTVNIIIRPVTLNQILAPKSGVSFSIFNQFVQLLLGIFNALNKIKDANESVRFCWKLDGCLHSAPFQKTFS